MQLIIKDKPRQLVWGTGCFEDVCDRLGLSLVDLDLLMADDQEKALREITYSALRNGADINDDVIDFNYKFFLNWLDQEPQGTAQDIMKDFLASKMLGKTMQEYYDDIIARFNESENSNQETKSVKKKHTPLEK